MDYQALYQQKLTTPEQAVKAVKSGDYGGEEAHPLADDLPVHAGAVPGVPGEVVAGIIRLGDLGHPHGDASPHLHGGKEVFPCRVNPR